MASPFRKSKGGVHFPKSVVHCGCTKVFQRKDNPMEKLKVCLKPALLVAVYVTVVYFTLSMAATFGPALQTVLEQT